MITLDMSNAVCFDTETSGLDGNAEICEISVLDVVTEEVLFSHVIKTSKLMSPEVVAIHGITNEMSQAEKPITYWWKFLAGNILSKKILIGYNVFFDIRMIFQSYSAWLPNESYYMSSLGALDIVQVYDQVMKPPKHKHLNEACESLGVILPEGKFHGSAFDSLATIRLYKKLMEVGRE
jgi:DNA polymerase-3 subunit epsilon